jgi:hypothetical protein
LAIEINVGIEVYDIHFQILICVDDNSLTCIEFKLYRLLLLGRKVLRADISAQA